MTYLINVDIGGTHTDGVAIDMDGQIIDGKVPSTPSDFAGGFFNSVELLAEKLGMTVSELLSETSLVSHGTTVGTNAILEGDDVDIALVTTRGMEDVLRIQRGSKGLTDGLSIEEYLNPHQLSRPDPLIPSDDIYGMDERIDCKGEVVTEFNDATADRIVEEIADANYDAVAVSFMWSFLNDAHEQAMASRLEQTLGKDTFITTSSDLTPVSGEYERTAAAAINALTGPVTSEYITEVEERLKERGYDGTLLVMNVGGGLLPAGEAIQEPVRTIDSGPAAGIVGCNYLGSKLDHENIIAADMGGTSFDVGIITDGEPITHSSNVIRQYAYRIRNIEVESVGSGGGSIAWVDDATDRLRVGPKSAGADPGPVCYDRGGTEPTITDADLLCGFLDPERFLGGRESVDIRSAREAIGGLADRLGVDNRDVIKGIVEISNAKMADLVRRKTIKSGYDPRQFRIYAYGGAGPLHVPLIAAQLDVKEVVIPTGESSAVWSSVGISSTDVLHREEVSNVRKVAPFDPDELTTQYEEIEATVRDQLREEGFDETEMTFERLANLRYGAQIHEVPVPVPEGRLTETDVKELIDRFEQLYEKRFGEDAGAKESGYELLTVRCDGYGRTTKPRLQNKGSRKSEARTPDVEEVFWPSADDSLETTVYDHTNVQPGLTITGPGIIRLRNTTITVPPTTTARTDEYGNIRIK